MIDNIREILDHYSIEYQEKFGSSEIDILCPFHDDVHFGSAKYNPTKDTFFCFSCHASGNRFQFVSRLEGCSIKEAEQLLENDFQEGKKNYNVQVTISNLNRRKQHFLNKVNNNTLLLDKTVINMMQNISDKKPHFSFLQQWLPIITFLHSPSSEKLKDQNILQLHDNFSQQIRSLQ